MPYLVLAGFIAGILLIHQLPELPSPHQLMALAGAGSVFGLLVLMRRGHPAWALLAAPAASLLLGSALAGTQGWWLITQYHLPEDCLYRDITVTGTVTGLPSVMEEGVRFELRPLRSRPDHCTPASGRLLTYWPQKANEPVPMIEPGQQWQFTLRLKPIRNFHTPGAADMEALRLARGIRYRARVRAAERLPDTDPGIDGLRWHLSRWLADAAIDDTARGILPALVTGDRQGLRPDHWDVLRRTGTVHLMAISGLHVGLVAGIVLLLVRPLWSLVPFLAMRLPAPRAAAIATLVTAAGYAALAGFTLPTQRALLMLSLWLGGRALGLRLSPPGILVTSLFLMALWDPFSLNLPGFWLSFAAVGLLMLALQGWERRGLLANWLRSQGVLAAGLLPLQALFFHGASTVAPAANLLAIPVVGNAIVPLLLLASLLRPLSEAAAQALMNIASFLLYLCWIALEWLGTLPMAWLNLPRPAPLLLLLSILGIGWLLLPRGWPLRLLGLPLALLVLVPATPTPEEGTAMISVLDVGQGQAISIRTRQHLLIFDAGPAFGPGLDAGRTVIIPWLRQQGLARINRLIVSHGDADHAGGLRTLNKEMSPDEILYGDDPRLQALRPGRPCRAGEAWKWDGVSFTVVHPPEYWPLPGNEGSCVLRVAAGEHAVLLTGDIEDLAEFRLARSLRESIDVLLLAHHGSSSSTTSELLDQLRPSVALVSTGARNRFGFPHQLVRKRLAERGIPLHDTAKEGMLELRLAPDRPVELLPGGRIRLRRWWHEPMQFTKSSPAQPADMPNETKSSMIRASLNP